MKKSIIIVILFGSLIGFIFSKVVFKSYANTSYLEYDGNIYYLQYGVYTSNQAALSNTSTLSNYKIVEFDEKYYVYLGITSNYENALKIQKIYQDSNIYTYIRDDYVSNSETLKELKKYDETLINLNTKEEIEPVLKEILNDSKVLF